MTGNNSKDWIEANDTELDRLINKSGTMTPIYAEEVPEGRE
jgi:hypothetical protein